MSNLWGAPQFMGLTFSILVYETNWKISSNFGYCN